MSNRNNISPFPFFLDKGEQTKWYAFGRDYVYLSPKRYILPFQIQRAERKDFAPSDAIVSDYIDGYLDKNGNLVEQSGLNAGVGSIDASEITNGYLYINNMPSPVFYQEISTRVRGAQISFVNGSGQVIKVENPITELGNTTWSGMVAIPQGTTTIYVTQ